MKLHLILILGFFSFIFKKNEASDVLYFEEYNTLENVSPQLNEYLNLIKSGNENEIDIFHIGDSHIQIGEFSKGFINYFHDNKIFIQKSWYLPTLIFNELSFNTKSLIKVNGSILQENVTQKKKISNIGLTGRTFSLLEKETVLKFKFSESVKQVEFLHSARDNMNFESEKSSVLKKVNLSKEEVITQLNFLKPRNKFQIKIENHDKKSLEFYAMRHNFIENKVSYSNFGVSGAKFSDFIFATKFLEQLEALKPEILIITLGTNDSYFAALDEKQFSSDLKSFIEKIKNISPKTELILMTAPDTYYRNSKPKHLVSINSEIEVLAKQENCALWNWYKIMGGEDSGLQWQKQKLMSEDMLHFTSKGYLLLGKLFGKSFLKTEKN